MLAIQPAGNCIEVADEAKATNADHSPVKEQERVPFQATRLLEKGITLLSFVIHQDIFR
jgi:hypothetical protein